MVDNANDVDVGVGVGVSVRVGARLGEFGAETPPRFGDVGVGGTTSCQCYKTFFLRHLRA
jgi:hypothetical protein